jgi:hypothetical protein
MVVELRNGRTCTLLVGSIVLDADGPSDIPADGDDEAPPRSGAEFTSDPLLAQALVLALQAVVRHARTHFAFSQASMALHADMCPAPSHPAQSRGGAK